MTNFERLKEICREACHERHACQPGFEALMRTKNVGEILSVWKDNWQDIYESKYADIIVEKIADVYADMKAEFNANDVFVNEPSSRGIVIVCKPSDTITVFGTAKAYIFGSGKVAASDNAEVYCRDEEGYVILTGHSQGFFKAGVAWVNDFAKAQGVFSGTCFGAAYIILQGGFILDHGHREISAFGDAVVYSDIRKRTELFGNAQLLPASAYMELQEKEDKQ